MIRECSQAIQKIGDDPSNGDGDHDGDHDSPEDCYRTQTRGFKSLLTRRDHDRLVIDLFVGPFAHVAW